MPIVAGMLVEKVVIHLKQENLPLCGKSEEVMMFLGTLEDALVDKRIDVLGCLLDSALNACGELHHEAPTHQFPYLPVFIDRFVFESKRAITKHGDDSGILFAIRKRQALKHIATVLQIPLTVNSDLPVHAILDALQLLNGRLRNFECFPGAISVAERTELARICLEIHKATWYYNDLSPARRGRSRFLAA